MNFSDNLKKFRSEKRLTMEELASKLSDQYGLKINKSTISRWEKGSEPGAKTLFYLSDFFKTTPAYLLGLPEESYTVNDTINLPITNEVFCGNGVITYQEILGYEPTPKEWLNGGEYFYLKARGNSMIGARIHDGDLVLIRKQPFFEDGEICCVFLNGETLLKRVFKQDKQIILQSENNEFPPKIVNSEDDFRIIGKLKRVVIKF
ncbi:helix-turn-helix domain-containing protein [Macrococcoides canis]|uniref:helix-turn-helix domain-containing protein n=1 Tax=Macrococcoides canis TaxID=1855823 RepID=UPI001AA08615|nr:XRE family transcriptional regulator [Macrococcus canis]